MREILFRGKRAHNDEWIFGSLHIEKFENDEEYLCCEINQCDVYPETVGQYTGLTDKNGQKIFEGDIVKIYLFDTKRLANYEIGYIKWAESKARYVFCSADGCYSIDDSNEYEIIGNTHDTPELLKGGAEQ